MTMVGGRAQSGARERGEPAERRAATASVGMIVTLSSLAMTFAALLLAYGIVRAQAPAWPPPGETPLPPLWRWRLAATVASLAGSVAMVRATRAARRDGPGVGRALGAAAAAGVVFLGAQTAAFAALGRAGIGPGSGLAASVVYALGLFHALHALAALAALAALGPWGGDAGRRGEHVRATPARVASVAAFWHLVTAVWIAVFVGVFVL